MPPQPKFVIFANHATYDTLHQVATLGLTAAAMGKDVIVILLFWTIKKLAEGKIDQVDFPPEYATSADEVARLLKGTTARVCGIALVAFWVGVAVLIWRRPQSPTRTDIELVRFGYLPLMGIAFFLVHFIWTLRGV